MRKFYFIAGIFLFTVLQLYAQPAQKSSIAYAIPNGIDRSVKSKVKEKIRCINAFDVEPRSQHVRSNGKIVEEIGRRGLLTKVRREKKVAFYISNESAITEFNGKKSSKSASINDLRMINQSFMVSQPAENLLPDDGYQNQIAHEWWKKNQQINYMPLRISLIDYYQVAQEESNDKSDQVFCAVAPIFTAVSSQLVTFGFEKEFLFSNTSSGIKSISLFVNGEEFEIGHRGTVVIGFPQKGDYIIQASITMQDNRTFSSAFNLSVQPLIDGTWSNSKINEHGNLDFIF